jgi:thiamine-monophosphate kinase
LKTLRDIGEDRLIELITAIPPCDPSPEAGPGDDCAVIDPGSACDHLRLLKTDALVAGIHFTPEASPRSVGWKAIARVVSDFAAMGGCPQHFLITLALPPETRVSWVEALYQGMADGMSAFNAVLAGGETTAVPTGSAAVISVAATGCVHRSHLVLRSSGKPGQTLLVTGTLGGSIRSKHLTFTPRIREAQWLVTHHKPTAMMDVSDGLAKDLSRLAKASGCGAVLDRPSLPITPGCTPDEALGDGEDFELLIAMAPERVPALLTDWKSSFPMLPLTVIGSLVEPTSGESLTGGWEHFAEV